MSFNDYFKISREAPKGMLLYSLPDPNDEECWSWGQRFAVEPEIPIVVEIVTGYEKWNLIPYFAGANLISDELYKVLCDAGVDNVDVYDAVIRSEDGKTEYRGYKAFNLLSVIRLADLKDSRDTLNNSSRLLDGVLMFRLGKFSGDIVVHRSVKEAIEASGLSCIRFQKLEELLC
jgi:hypothetical protein